MTGPPQSGPPPPGSGPPEPPARPGPDAARDPRTKALDDALAREQELRRGLSERVTERRRLSQEADRLEGQVVLPGAQPRLGEVARRYRARADELEREIETLRSQLRTQEALVAERRAEADGV